MATQETKNSLNCIIQAITNIVDPKVANLKYDKTYRAKITEKIDAGVYKVQINGKEYQLSYNGTLSVGDIVKVKAPLNNFSDIYIETVPSSGGGTGGTSDYNDLTNKPQLNTNSSVSQATSSDEIIKGTIKLHKISKTGNYNDLLNKPNVEDGAQVNVIETIQKNGVDLPISNKTVNITVPTKTSDLTNNSGFLSELPIASKTQLGGIKVGNNLTITADGILNATGGGTGSNEVDISETEPTEDTVELWVDLSESDIAGDAQIIDNLESTSTTDALSANQGRVLNNKIDNLTTVYTGTNITAPTCEGFGKIKKLYGKTEEIGEGEKSPDNPYEINCVADDVNLFNIDDIVLGGISQTDGSNITSSNLYRTEGYINVKSNTSYVFNIISSAVRIFEYDASKTLIKHYAIIYPNNTFITAENTVYIRSQRGSVFSSETKLQEGEVATEYSPYGEGTVKITSTDGTNTSNKVITCKSLCCLKDSEGNIVAQDYIDFTRQKIVRQCGYLVLNGTEEWVKSSATDFDRFVLYTSYDILDNCESISNLYKTNRGTGWSSNEYKLDNYQNGHRVIVNAGAYGSLTLEQFKANLATNNLIIVFEKGTPIEEDIDTTNSIVQYSDETTISNSDNAEMEVELTKNKAISSINDNIGNLQEKDNDLNDRINEVNTNLNDKITSLTKYSTNEVKTGETWIDGKPIYRKVIQVTSTSGNTTEIDLSSLNISTIFFDLSKSYYKWNAHTRILPVISVNVESGTASSTDVAKNQCGVYYNYSNKKMVCEFGNSRKIYNGVVTIEYTKTTD